MPHVPRLMVSLWDFYRFNHDTRRDGDYLLLHGSAYRGDGEAGW